MRTTDEINRFVFAEMSSFRMPAVHEWAQALLVEPHRHFRTWEFGPPGQQFECWLIAKSLNGKRGIVYSDHGHADHWGLVWIDEHWFGPDSCWFMRLEDAFVDLGWEGELPEGYEVA